MSARAGFLSELDHEAANTRRMLERIPEEKLAWRPHPRSWTMGELATHLAQLSSWAVTIVETDSLDLDSPGGQEEAQRTPAGSLRDLLETFDRSTAAARSAVAGARDEHLLRPWTLLKGGRVVLSLPRIAVLRNFVISHGVHHRAQLGVYLRLNDVPVPGMYGPTADEGGF